MCRKVLCIALLSTLVAVTAFAAPKLVGNRTLADQTDGRDWPASGRDFSENRHSPLVQISAANIDRLGLICSLDLSDQTRTATAPIEVSGVIYLPLGYSVVHAVNAKSGKLLWRFDTDVTRLSGQKLRVG